MILPLNYKSMPLVKIDGKKGAGMDKAQKMKVSSWHWQPAERTNAHVSLIQATRENPPPQPVSQSIKSPT